jgi:hypothetical protein
MKKEKRGLFLLGLLLPFCLANSPAPFSEVAAADYSTQVAINAETGTGLACLTNLTDSELDIGSLAVGLAPVGAPSSQNDSFYLLFSFGKIPAKTTSFWSKSLPDSDFSSISKSSSGLGIHSQEVLGNVYENSEFVVGQDFSYSSVSVSFTRKTTGSKTYTDFTFDAVNFGTNQREYTRFFSFDYLGARRSTLASGGDVLSLEGEIDPSAFTNLECRLEKKDKIYYRNKTWNRFVALALTILGLFCLSVLALVIWLVIYLSKRKKNATPAK